MFAPHKMLSVSLAALALAASAPAWAEPDITGMWALNQPTGPDGERLHRDRPQFTPAARAAQDQVNKINQANHRLIGEAHTKCLPTGMPGLMSTPFGIEFLQTKGRITILNEVSNLPRTIYLDEKTHPDSVIPGWNGHSIGHWDGDTLYVDTIGFNGRNPNVSEQMHMTEKLYLKDSYLFDEMTLDDPLTYVTPYKVTYRYKRAEPGVASEVMEYVCEVDIANLVAYEAEQKAAGRPSDFDPAWAAQNFSSPAPKATAAK
ncbi:MAG TPA: hypothetical protein VG960_09600 [Caulobacteraceae bacterium]|nr:hypothetical protein [Caulobacteraceae bacterium]